MIVVGKIVLFILVNRSDEMWVNLATPYTLMTAKPVQSYMLNHKFKQF